MATKRYILFLFTLIFFIGPFLATIILIAKKQDLKSEFLKRFSNEKKITIVLNKTDIVWEDEGSELIIHNHLFDIDKITYQNNKAIITGWFDGDEDNLNIAIEKQNQQQENKDSDIPFFSYTFCEQIPTFKLEPFLFYVPKKYFIYNLISTNFSIEFVSPPPQIV